MTMIPPTVITLQTQRSGVVIALQKNRNNVVLAAGSANGVFVNLFITADAGKLMTPDANEFLVSA